MYWKAEVALCRPVGLPSDLSKLSANKKAYEKFGLKIVSPVYFGLIILQKGVPLNTV